MEPVDQHGMESGAPEPSDLQPPKLIGPTKQAGAPGRLHFWSGGIHYSVALNALREALLTLPPVTPLPFSPAWLVGLIPLRTELVAMVDLHALLRREYGTDSNGDTPRIAEQALMIGETDRLIALMVDRIGDIAADTEPEMDADVGGGDVLGTPSRYVDGVYATATADGSPPVVVALNLIRLYEDVLERLEVWSRDA